MELITLEMFKAHARIDGDDEDSAAQVKVDAANAYVSSFLANPLPDGWVTPDDLVQATLQIASSWWENRETSVITAVHDVPVNASEVIASYREWQF